MGSVPEAVNAVANTEDTRSASDTPGRDPARWDRFVIAARALGVTGEELARHFPHEEDREDIRLTPDADIMLCARTVADAVMRERVSSNAVRTLPAVRRRKVRCIDCRHFARSDVATGYGTCAAGVPSTGATALHFATHQRSCTVFDEAPS